MGAPDEDVFKSGMFFFRVVLRKGLSLFNDAFSILLLRVRFYFA